MRPGDDIGISVVTLLELAHAVVGGGTAERREKRQRLLGELMRVVSPHPQTVSTALHAGGIDGERQATGIRIPLSD